MSLLTKKRKNFVEVGGSRVFEHRNGGLEDIYFPTKGQILSSIPLTVASGTVPLLAQDLGGQIVTTNIYGNAESLLIDRARVGLLSTLYNSTDSPSLIPYSIRYDVSEDGGATVEHHYWTGPLKKSPGKFLILGAKSNIANEHLELHDMSFTYNRATKILDLSTTSGTPSITINNRPISDKHEECLIYAKPTGIYEQTSGITSLTNLVSGSWRVKTTWTNSNYTKCFPVASIFCEPGQPYDWGHITCYPGGESGDNFWYVYIQTRNAGATPGFTDLGFTLHIKYSN